MIVVLAKGNDRQQNISKVLHRLADRGCFPRFQTVLIKPNLVGVNEIHSNSSVDAVRAIVDFLKVHFAPQKIVIGEGSGGAYASGISTRDVFKTMGYEELEKIENVELVNLDELHHGETFHVDTYEGKRILHWMRPKVDFIISLTLPKTHDIAIATLGLKNMMGLIAPEDRKKMHGYCDTDGKDSIRLFKDDIFYLQCVEMIHKNVYSLINAIKPDLTVIDGFQGMEGNGPVRGTPTYQGYALASFDPIAADFVGFQLMGLDPRSIGYLFFAMEKLPKDWMPDIVGDDPQSLIKRYRLHYKYHLQSQWLKS